jgi:hypothetical protein
MWITSTDPSERVGKGVLHTEQGILLIVIDK